jgi:hypothetical protein
MRRTYKKQNKNTGFFTFKVFALMVFITIGAILYIWQRVAITQLGYRIAENEVKVEKLLDDKARYQSLIAKMESPSNINSLLASLNLNIGQNKNPKIIKVKL